MSDVRLLHTNKYLTNFATAYRVGESVADFIAPPFKVMRPSDKYLTYGKGNLRVYNNKIGRREKSKGINPDATEATYSCEEYALHDFIYERDKSNVDEPIRLEEVSAQNLKDAMMLSREKRVLDIAGSASFVTQTSSLSAGWNTQASGTPVKNILDAMKTVKQACTKRPNRIVMTDSVALTLIQTDEWKDYFKYTWGLSSSGDGLFDAIAGLRHIGLEPKISGMFGVNTAQGDSNGSDPTIEEMLGDSVIIFYAEPNPTLQTRTFMYSPFVSKDIVYRYIIEEERGVKIEMVEDVDELLVDAQCAYLYTNAI